MSTDPRQSEAIRAALKGYEPTDEQWSAISHPLEPIYLIAGAGSGKTAVMAARISWALETQSFSPSQVLGLTFTNKAAEELQDRVRLALSALHDESSEDVSIFTYNALAAGIVRDHGLLVGVESDAGLLSDAQQWQLVLGCLDDLPPFDSLEVRSSYVVGQTLGLAGSIGDHMVAISDIEAAADRLMSMKGADEAMIETARKRKELCRAVAAYMTAKSKAGRVDFGDQITKAVEVLEGNEEVRDSYHKRFPFVLLDEYQDTNVAQRRMLQALIRPRGAVTAVGDARQAIFAWRGATMFNLINFARDFPRAGGQPYEPISLSENFRSGSRILEVANSVVEEIDPSRRPGAPLRSVRENGEGKVEIGLFSDERAEATFIAERCRELHGKPTALGREPAMWKDMAILVRRKAAMDMVLQALDEAGVPVEVIGLGGLLKTPEVTEVVAWLRALETKPGANRWLARILLGPRWRIHYRDLALLSRWSAEQNWSLRVRLAAGDQEQAREMEPGDVGFALAESLGHLDEIGSLGEEAKERLKAFSKQLASIRRRTNAPLLELVQEIIRQAGIGDALDSSTSDTAAAARQNISNFLDQVASFSPVEGEATLRSFIAYLDAAEAAEETLEATQPAEQDSVKLMTVHSAKGLEFECVFVPSVASGSNKHGDAIYSIFPNTRGSNPLTSYSELPYEVREDASHLPRFEGKLGPFQKAVRERVIEDERRLFYVALTRAKQRLHVTASWWYGRDRIPKGASPFWLELEKLADKGLVDIVERYPEADGKNPLFDAMEDRRVWPPVARLGLDDALFSQGWGSAADDLVAGRSTVVSLLEPLGTEEEGSARALIEDHQRDLRVIAESATPPAPTEPRTPDIISATSWVRLQEGQISAWDLVRPFPNRPTSARRIGTEVHRLIEERSRGLSAFPDESELDGPAEITEPGVIAEMLDRFEERYGGRDLARLPSGEPMVELPFTMLKDEQIIRGRIDAVYESEDGGLQIVDFKTGRRFTKSDEADQLELYAEALKMLGFGDREVTIDYVFLAEDAEVAPDP